MAGRDAAGRAVVLLWGEHDLATTRDVSDTLARVIGVDDADVVVDLSGVEFMDASTIGVLLKARAFLSLRARSLTLGEPAPLALRVLRACGLTDLIAPNALGSAGEATGALASWVAVPSRARQDQPPAVSGDGEPERTSSVVVEQPAKVSRIDGSGGGGT